MNRKQTTILAAVATTALATMLIMSGVANPAYSSTPSSGGSSSVTASAENKDPNTAAKIMVEIDSPYGNEVINSFKLFQTDNLMAKSGYHTLRLQGPITEGKSTLLHWIANDLGGLPDGLFTALPITTGGGKPAVMTKPKEGAKIDVVPLTGKVKLQLLEGTQDMYATKKLREIEFSGCHVAGYNLGSNFDDEKVYYKDGNYMFEEIVFACTDLKELSSSAMNSRSISVERPFNASTRGPIADENGQLIITSREYRQPIIMESMAVEQPKQVKKEITTRIELDKERYNTDEPATFTVTFTDAEGRNIDPDTVKAIYDGKIVQLEKQDTGIYTYTTFGLTKAHHQIIVSMEKSGYGSDLTYLPLPINRIG